MSYRPGSYGLERLGITSGPPTITCDGGCGTTFEVKGRGDGERAAGLVSQREGAPKVGRRGPEA